MKLKETGNVEIKLSRKELSDLIPSHYKGEKKKRVCLMCRKTFNSKGAFNRRCSRCNSLLKKSRPRDLSQPKVYKLSNPGVFESYK